MKKKKVVSEEGKRVISDFEKKYFSELYDESPLSAGGRVSDRSDTGPEGHGPFKNTYGSQFYKKASSKAPEYTDPAKEAVRTFRNSYRRGD